MPNSPELHLARGVLYVQINHLDQAEADFTAADRLAPAKATSSVARALTKYQQNQRSEALAIINDELKTQPKGAFLYYLKAEILSSLGPLKGSIAYNDAVRAALRALELQPDLVLARHVLSRLYLDAGETTAAVNQCKLALRQDPYDQVALYRLMRAMRQNKAPGQAEQISQLMKRFNEAREKGRQREIQESRYRLLAEPGVR
jgi:tetratricopeptide (TPR) repeat protein